MEYEKNTWDFLNQFTQARIAIGRTGTSLPTHFLLHFRLEHAKARDAVYSILDKNKIKRDLLPSFTIFDLQTQAQDRLTYLKNPNQGRRLSPTSQELLQKNTNHLLSHEVVFVIADGLSATAVNAHAAPILNQVIPYLQAKKWEVAPICLVEQGRVACADEIAVLLKAKIAVILIGERPGLTAADSMGIYLTFQPSIGTTDERRNCISNIRPEGLTYPLAQAKIVYLLEMIKNKQLSGVALKDEEDLPTADFIKEIM
ncbi:ethanolamine ammonia-lyase subunit EutC [Thermoflexibacter ruber]|uniref:Ethanolamine ammonia-lyase small subunit n=1 Tax=Thermoflexibacter ruber TaxID=1003 RepID=A0A1I2D7X3_9BACT|nr:ethanolamine ammonia-lyase subunit EutC [Thermoflexibacter ruber]SFE76551.1 Ethanolamine ammonia-lyase light chain [Thermoflexibacter ruber]